MHYGKLKFEKNGIVSTSHILFLILISIAFGLQLLEKLMIDVKLMYIFPDWSF